MPTDESLPNEQHALSADHGGRLTTHKAVQNDWLPKTTLHGYQDLSTPRDGSTDIPLLLEELGQLCLLVSKRRFANSVISAEQPHLESYRSWIVAQARNVVFSLASKHNSLDNETIHARIEIVVSQLARTSAAPIAKTIDHICRHMNDLFTGRPLQALSENSKDQRTTVPNLKCRMLDIREGPISQHFLNDLIIASRMLRTSANVQSLGHLGQLLKPDGRLVVQEQGTFTHWVTYVFGVQREWWYGQDHASPEAHRPSKWDQQASAIGISGMSGGDGETGYVLTMFSIANEPLPWISSQDRINESISPVYDKPVSMIAEQIIKHLKNDGYRVIRSSLESEAQTDQDIISVESVDSGCATVTVVYN